MNAFKTFLFLFILMLLFVGIGWLVAGRDGAIIAFFLAVAMNFFTYWFSSSIVLKMYKAQVVTEAEAPELYGIVKELAAKANIPMPKVAIIPMDTPNAFATGRNPSHAVVAATTGIMKMLNRDELEGVLAHEITHVTGRDILISTIAATVAGAVLILSNMARYMGIFGQSGNSENRGSNPFSLVIVLLVSILAPIAASIVQLAVSRTREYEADAGAAKLTKNPMALASALQKISRGVQINPMDSNPATAHMFIINPLSGKKAASLFSTHPDVEDRISRLKTMARDMSPSKGQNLGGIGNNRNNPMFR